MFHIIVLYRKGNPYEPVIGDNESLNHVVPKRAGRIIPNKRKNVGWLG